MNLFCCHKIWNQQNKLKTRLKSVVIPVQFSCHFFFHLDWVTENPLSEFIFMFSRESSDTWYFIAVSYMIKRGTRVNQAVDAATAVVCHWMVEIDNSSSHNSRINGKIFFTARRTSLKLTGLMLFGVLFLTEKRWNTDHDATGATVAFFSKKLKSSSPRKSTSTLQEEA